MIKPPEKSLSACLRLRIPVRFPEIAHRRSFSKRAFIILVFNDLSPDLKSYHFGPLVNNWAFRGIQTPPCTLVRDLFTTTYNLHLQHNIYNII